MTSREYFDVALKQSELTDGAKEAKAKIEQEFISLYYEWRKDIADMSEHDFGWKYGFGKPKKEIKDNLSGVVCFQKYGFQGRWIQGWERAGYDRFTIWELVKKGFLSCKEYSNWQARASRCTEWVFISQATAKQIYKQAKKQ